jgi:hypothetical protein
MVRSVAHWIANLVKSPDKARSEYVAVKARWDAITAQYEHGAFGRAGGHFAVIETALKLASPKALPLTDAEIESGVQAAFAEWLSGYTSDANFSHEESGVIERAGAVLAQVGKFPPAKMSKFSLSRMVRFGVIAMMIPGMFMSCRKCSDSESPGTWTPPMPPSYWRASECWKYPAEAKAALCWQNVRPKAGGPQVVAYKMRHAPERSEFKREATASFFMG